MPFKVDAQGLEGGIWATGCCSRTGDLEWDVAQCLHLKMATCDFGLSNQLCVRVNFIVGL